jgi:tRNA pseudouridine32 synthase / 23S rRNA pseudouridine746 synthase
MPVDIPLPTINGIGPSSQWLPAGPWPTVLDFLSQHFPSVSRATWIARMGKDHVVNETGRPLNSLSPYRAGACVFYYREVEREKSIPFAERIIYRDEHILVADKPHFLPVVPAGRFLRETLLVRLKKSTQLEQLVPVHRLDRETAGLVMFSISPDTRGQYTALFRNRRVSKVYEAIARSRAELVFPLTRRSRLIPGNPFFLMQEVAGEPNTETRIELIEYEGDVARFRLHPLTGRKHQLRVHLAALGAPILNDKLYPVLCSGAASGSDGDFSQPVQLLARSISFADPLTGRRHFFESNRTLRSDPGKV